MSRTLLEAQSQFGRNDSAGTHNKHHLTSRQVSQQTKPRVTDDQIITHLRANPTMSMNQSRKLLGIGQKRYKKVKANFTSTDNDIILFNKANPNASQRSIKKSLHVGIKHYTKVTATTS